MPQPIRNNGLTSAAAAMQMLERRQQLIANNLANSNTRGFKAETSFARLIGDAVAATETAVDLTQGTLTETHNPLDLSVQGEGFFVVQAGPDQERLTRAGTFSIDADRRLVDANGHPVLGDDGPITLPKGDVTISTTGQVRVDAKAIAQLRLERVDPKARLVHVGGTQFEPHPSRTSIPLGDRDIRQGSVEESNVNTMATMSEMIEVMHRYGSAQKMVATIDSIRGIAANDLAKVV